jgi:hypothetical protein
MSTQYRLVQSGKTASGGCSAGQGSSEPVAPRIIIIIIKAQNLLQAENDKQKNHPTNIAYYILRNH